MQILGCNDVLEMATLFDMNGVLIQVTLDALGEMFQAARSIMKWLADCAKVFLFLLYRAMKSSHILACEEY